MSGDFLAPTLGASCGPTREEYRQEYLHKLITPSVPLFLPWCHPTPPGNYSRENTGEKMRVLFL